MLNNKCFLSAFLLMICLVLICAFAHADMPSIQETNVPGQMIAKGSQYFNKGNLEQAIILWEQVLGLLNAEKNTGEYLDTTVWLANAYQLMGYHQRALTVLHKALPVVEKGKDHYRNALLYNCLGDIYLSLGDTEASATYLLRGAEQARMSGNLRAMIMILNNLGNGVAADENYPAAMAFYDEALALIEKSEDHIDLKSKVLLNLVRLGLQMERYQEVAGTLDSVLSQIAEMPDSPSKASDMITLSRLISKIRKTSASSDGHLKYLAYLALDKAKRIAQNTQDYRTLSYAYGYMGQLYEGEKRYSEAVKLTRKAVFLAQQGDFPEILYLWQWQLGRLFKVKDDIENAVKAYSHAISVLNPIRQELFRGFRSREDLFNETVKPVYLGLTELLLRQAEISEDSKVSEAFLIKARDTMEILKNS